MFEHRHLFITIGLFLVFNHRSAQACFGYQTPAYSYNYVPPPPYAAAAKARMMASDSRLTPMTQYNFDETNNNELFNDNDYAGAATCSQRFAEHTLRCATAFEKRQPSTEAECRQLCVNHLLHMCQSFEFDAAAIACSLYDVTPADLPASGFSRDVEQENADAALLDARQSMIVNSGGIYDSYGKKLRKLRKRFALQNGVPNGNGVSGGSGSGGNGMLSAPTATNPLGLPDLTSLFKNIPGMEPPPQNCRPEIVAAKATVFEIVDVDCYRVNTAAQPTAASPFPALFGGLLNTPAPPMEYKVSPAPRFTAPPQMVKPFVQGFIPQSTARQLQPPPPFTNKLNEDGALVIPEMPDCVDGTRARIQLIDGITLSGEERPIVAVQLASADVCLHLCRQNAHLDGTRFPAICRAAVFDRATGRCEIIDDAITPNGQRNYAPNPNGVYFEKFCVPDVELSARDCDDVVHRIPQHTLDSRATGTGAVLTAKTQTDCIRRCINAHKKLGFSCASVSFFFEWPADNCYLSRFTRVNRPDIYVAERRHAVDYMELPACMKQRVVNVAAAAPLSTRGNRQEDWQHDDAFSALGPTESAAMTTRRHPTVFRQEDMGDTAEGVEDESTMVKNANGATKTMASTFAAASERDGTGGEDVGFFGPPQRAVFQSSLSSKKKSVASNDNNTNDLLEGADDRGNNNDDEEGGTLSATSLMSSSSSLAPSATSDSCDARRRCCPKETELKTLIRGCSIGYRLLKDGQRVSCVPDECQ